MKRKKGKFISKFASNKHLKKGGRKEDSNYFRRRIRDKKIAYISHLIDNTDQLLIVAAVTLPEFKSGLVDRFLILAELENVKPVIIITKIDLMAEGQKKEDFGDIYKETGYRLIYISNETGEGLDEAAGIFKGHSTALVGHSGVGKTTLLNCVDPEFSEKTAEISDFTKRGRHTTTKITMRELSIGGQVYDMPGLKEIDFISLTQKDLPNYYPEMQSYREKCKFSDCSHNHETQCAVKKALSDGKIHPVRYENYLNILESLPEY